MTTLSLNKKYCKSCFEEIKIDNLHSLLNKNICICKRCLDSMEPIFLKDKINNIKGTYLYYYNDFIKEKIYTLKGCGDIEMASIFLNYFLPYLRLKYSSYFLIAAPSSESSNKEREFNHVYEIFKPLNLKFLDCLYKLEDFKQSDLNKKEREKVKDRIGIKNMEQIRNKKILFVDDISTTGSTLKACLNLIKKYKPKKLEFLIIAKKKHN